jgi:hypothetical protein
MVWKVTVGEKKDTERGKSKNLEKNLSHCKFAHHRSHTD